jgi:hypothetical protein
MNALTEVKGFSYQLLNPKRLGTTDDVTTCDCCGKTNLKSTVVFKIKEELNNWNFVLNSHYAFLGSHCALNVPMYSYYKDNRKHEKINIQKFKVIGKDFQIMGTSHGGQFNVGFRWDSKTSILFVVCHDGKERHLHTPKQFADMFNRITFNRQEVKEFLEFLQLVSWWGEKCVDAIF